jgi:hypothetical protein
LEQSVAFFQDRGIFGLCAGFKTDQNPGVGVLKRLLKMFTQVVMQQASKPIADDGPFADLATDDHSASTHRRCSLFLGRATIPTQKLRHRRGFTQGHQRAVEELTPAMQMIETAVTAQSHGRRKHHRIRSNVTPQGVKRC